MNWLSRDLDRHDRQVCAHEEREEWIEERTEKLMESGEEYHPYTFEHITEAIANWAKTTPEQQELIRAFLMGELTDGPRVFAYQAIRAITHEYWRECAECEAERELLNKD